MPSISREFGSVFVGDKNVASLVVAEGWAKVIYFLVLCIYKYKYILLTFVFGFGL